MVPNIPLTIKRGGSTRAPSSFCRRSEQDADAMCPQLVRAGVGLEPGSCAVCPWLLLISEVTYSIGQGSHLLITGVTLRVRK